MKPADTTKAGLWLVSVSASAASQSAREGKSATRHTNVGMPAASARA